MQRKLLWLGLCSVLIAITTLYHAGILLATPANPGYKATTIANGTFEEIDAFNHARKDMLPVGFDGDVWRSRQKSVGRSELYVQSNIWQPGGSTGWHTHPGHSLIIVTGGTVTEYDDECIPHAYTFVPGQPAPTLVDPGNRHVHIIRNESSTETASTIAVQLVPYDPRRANRRIDAPAPENCLFIN